MKKSFAIVLLVIFDLKIFFIYEQVCTARWVDELSLLFPISASPCRGRFGAYQELRFTGHVAALNTVSLRILHTFICAINTEKASATRCLTAGRQSSTTFLPATRCLETIYSVDGDSLEVYRRSAGPGQCMRNSRDTVSPDQIRIWDKI